MAANGFGSAMFEQAGRGSRILFVGFAFLAFDIGGLMVRMLFFPLLLVSVRDEQSRAEVARDFIGWSYRSLIAFLRSSGVLDYKLSVPQKLSGWYSLILANHPTFLDIVFLMAVVKRSDCIVKSGLWRNPFLRGPVIAAELYSQRPQRRAHARLRGRAQPRRIPDHLSRGHAHAFERRPKAAAWRGPHRRALRLQYHAGAHPLPAADARAWRTLVEAPEKSVAIRHRSEGRDRHSTFRRARGERGFGGTAPDRSSARFFCKGTAHPCKRLKMR